MNILIAYFRAAHQSFDSKNVNQFSIAKRLATTNEQLKDLLCDGQELITNIKLANDRRENGRKQQEEKQRAQLMSDLQNECDEATNKLNIIKSRWFDLVEITNPMELNERLQCQNERIKNLMQQKDAIITELQDALNKGNERYNIDQVKQGADIQCLIERIDEQIEVMKNVYLEHLELLHQSIDSERRTFKTFHSNEWQELFDERTAMEQQNINELIERNENYYAEIAAIQLQHEEINRDMRIKLDRDNDLVQQKLQDAKAEINLNTEQLNYNYYVLQKRAAENIILRNKQKNRLIKMRACIAMMRKNITDTKAIQTMEIKRQTHDVLAIYANIKDLEHKMIAFAERDDDKVKK